MQRLFRWAGITAFIIGTVLFSSGVPSRAQQSPVVFDKLGASTWMVPSGVTKIRVKVWGAGGAGGTGYKIPNANSGGGGGGGGGYAEAVLNVTPDTPYDLVVGESGKFIYKGSSRAVDSWDVVVAGNSEFSVSQNNKRVYTIGAGGGGSGGVAGGVGFGGGIAGKGYGGNGAGSLGSGAGGADAQKNSRNSGGGGGSGYFVGVEGSTVAGVSKTGDTGESVTLRGSNIDAGAGGAGAVGGAGGARGRCGRTGKGNNCVSDGSDWAKDGVSPAAGGGGADTGGESGDSAGYGANGKIIIEILASTSAQLQAAKKPKIQFYISATGNCDAKAKEAQILKGAKATLCWKVEAQ